MQQAQQEFLAEVLTRRGVVPPDKLEVCGVPESCVLLARVKTPE